MLESGDEPGSGIYYGNTSASKLEARCFPQTLHGMQRQFVPR